MLAFQEKLIMHPHYREQRETNIPDDHLSGSEWSPRKIQVRVQESGLDIAVGRAGG